MKVSEVLFTNLGRLFNSNVYPLIKPESEKGLPYLVYTVLNANPENTLDGYTGYEMAYIQLDIYALDYDTCEDLTNNTLETLNTNLKPFHYENRRYLYENDTGLYRQSIECYLWQSDSA